MNPVFWEFPDSAYLPLVAASFHNADDELGLALPIPSVSPDGFSLATP